MRNQVSETRRANKGGRSLFTAMVPGFGLSQGSSQRYQERRMKMFEKRNQTQVKSRHLNPHTSPAARHQRVPAKIIFSVPVLLLLVISVGCSHSMRVKNLGDYSLVQSTGPRMDVALAPFSGTPDQEAFYNAAVDGLRSHRHVKMVRTDWTPERREQGFNPTHTVSLAIKPEYKGSGANFPITFPGFILFTCAWHGFHYSADVTTEIELQPYGSTVNQVAISDSYRGTVALASAGDTDDITPLSADEALARSEDLDMHFDMRHCSANRGFWSGSGWWLPGYGGTNIIAGAIFTKYDKKATDPFHKEADQTYGDYVAEKVVQLLKNPVVDDKIAGTIGDSVSRTQ